MVNEEAGNGNVKLENVWIILRRNLYDKEEEVEKQAQVGDPKGLQEVFWSRKLEIVSGVKEVDQLFQ